MSYTFTYLNFIRVTVRSATFIGSPALDDDVEVEVDDELSSPDVVVSCNTVVGTRLLARCTFFLECVVCVDKVRWAVDPADAEEEAEEEDEDKDGEVDLLRRPNRMLRC